MTIQGARDELLNMMECKDLPIYFVPILQKVVETIEMEIATVCDIEQIRDEILNFKEKCNASDYLGCGILEIIDRYTKGAEG